MSNTLQAPVPVSYNEFTKQASLSEWIELNSSLKPTVDIFYSKNSMETAIAQLDETMEEQERSKKVLAAVIFHPSQDENSLIISLQHREEQIRENAVQTVFNKLQDLGQDTNEEREFLEKLKVSPKSLTKAMNTKKLEVLKKVVQVIFRVLAKSGDEFKNAIRQTKGFKSIVRALSLPHLIEDEQCTEDLLIIIFTLLEIDQNKIEFRKETGIPRLLPYLASDRASFKRMATSAFLRLSSEMSNIPAIATSGILEYLVKNSTKSEKEIQIKYETLRVIKNMCRTPSGREHMSEKELVHLLSYLDADRTSQISEVKDRTKDQENEILIQCITLEALFEAAQEERICKILSSKGTIERTVPYLNPIKNGTCIKNVLQKALLLLDLLADYEDCRSKILNTNALQLIAKLLQEVAVYPEECIMGGASLLTKLAVNATSKQQQFTALAFKKLHELFEHFPSTDLLQDLLANVIHKAITIGENKELILKDGGDKLLMNFIRNSNLIDILSPAYAGIAALIGEASVIQTLIHNNIVPKIVSHLQFNQPQLQPNIIRVISAVAASGETGRQLIRGCISPMVALLEENDEAMQENIISTLAKLIQAPGDEGQENMNIFFCCEGERVVVELMTSTKNKRIQMGAMLIIQVLTTDFRNREFLREVQILERIRELEQRADVKSHPTISKILLLMKKNMQEDGDLVDGPDGSPVYKLKVSFKDKLKLIPVIESLKYDEFLHMIKKEFEITSWDKISVFVGEDEIEIVDTRTIKWIIHSIKKGVNLVVEVQQYQLVDTEMQSLDALLRRLSHKQIRILITQAITKHTPQVAGKSSEKIRAFINENRTLKQSAKEETVDTQPYGFGIKPSEVVNEDPNNPSNNNNDLTEDEKQALMPPPPPPPPGLLDAVSAGGRLKATTGGVNLLSGDLEEAIKARKLKAANVKKNEVKKTLISEEIAPGARLYLSDKKAWVDTLVRVMIQGYDVMHVIYKIIDKSDLPFKKAMEITEGTIEKEILAKMMTQCGFTVSMTRWKLENANLRGAATNSDKPSEEIQYEFIITPYSLPRATILRIIQAIISKNSNARIGGPLTNSVEKLLIDFREKKKKEEETKGDVVRGFWNRKEKVQIKSVWDD